jgi:hypothetical protein
MRHIGQRRRRLAVMHEGQGVAELQIEIDQQHGLGFGQLVGQVGGEKRRATAAFAGHEGQHLAGRLGPCAGEFGRNPGHGCIERIGRCGRGQDFAHAHPHRVDQELGRLGRAQQDDRDLGMVGGDIFHLGQLIGVAAHAIDEHQVGLLLLGNRAHPAFPPFDERDAVGLRFERAAHVLQVGLVG